jgi:spermidine synthase
VRAQRDVFDFVVIDFPDPTGFSIGKLYTTAFFEQARGLLAPDGMMAVQCTSPYVARRSFWCVNATLRAVGLHTEPYHVYVPSFGEWGFILASRIPPRTEPVLPEGLRFLTRDSLVSLFQFPPDMGPMEVEVNRLNNQMLVRYFEEEWAHYVH